MKFQHVLDYALAAYNSAGAYLGHENTGFCLTSGDAQVLANSFGQTISNYTTALAVQLFTNDFTDQSDSVNSLIRNSPLPDIPVCLGFVLFYKGRANQTNSSARTPSQTSKSSLTARAINHQSPSKSSTPGTHATQSSCDGSRSRSQIRSRV